MSDLDISQVVNISVSEAGPGVSEYNTSNVAIFSDEATNQSFGSGDYKIYVSPTGVGEDFGTSSKTYEMALALFSQNPNILANNGYLVIIPFENNYDHEDLERAIDRMQNKVAFFGVMATGEMDDQSIQDAADKIQTLNKIGFFVGTSKSDAEANGKLAKLASGSKTQSRGLYYGRGNETDALKFMAAYAGRALSTNFNGSNTTQTMHLKTLSTIQPDDTVDTTFLTKAQDNGVDVYPSIQGVAKVYTSGENDFFDQVYHKLWFVGALEVAGFNTLAQLSTKLPQTENGMNALKSEYRKVCERAVTNNYVAPGSWNSATTFGNQEDFFDNISQFGYYIYSKPVSQQSQTDREDRKAPLVQIAIKEAGAVHSSTVIVNVNA